MVAKGVIVGFALLALVDRCLALSCVECDPDLVCPTPTCSYGLTRENCGCCDVCARGPGAVCGGIWPFSYGCGEGLNCEKELICDDNACVYPSYDGIGTCVAREIILSSKREGPEADGSYSFLFVSSDGIFREERGYPQGEDGDIVQEGSYLYPLPDGSFARFDYTADANGFRVESPLLPTPPPMPPHALAQIEKAKRERELIIDN